MNVYLITNVRSGRQYVGKANSPAARYADHWRAAVVSLEPGPLYDSMRTDGREAFTFEVLQACASEKEAYQSERAWIERLETTQDRGGFNQNRGGSGGSRRPAPTLLDRPPQIRYAPELISLLFDPDLHARTDLVVQAYSRNQ